MTRVQRYWLLAPLMLCYWIDIAITMIGQSREYWHDGYQHASDLNPIAKLFLKQDPWLFLGLAILWAGLICVAVICWNHKFIQWAAVVLTVLHAVGGSTWLYRIEPWGWGLAIVYLVLTAQFSKWCWRPSNSDVPH